MGAINRYWDNCNYLKIYFLARDGLSDAKIASALRITYERFLRMHMKDYAIHQAIEKGRADRGIGARRFSDYVFDRLPEELKPLVDKINACENLPSATARIEALLENQGRSARQHLFVFFLINSHFDASAACKAVAISKRLLDQWILEDPEFRELVEHEVHWHKQNFVEGALMRGVDAGDSNLIKFAAVSLLADRGYQDRKVKEVSGMIDHNHQFGQVAGSTKEFMNRLTAEEQRVFLALWKKGTTATSLEGAIDGQVQERTLLTSKAGTMPDR